ncbi:rhodanese-related sulfurtransferase [Candidatus Saccharibacteria bacterium]|nr:rhodanese-related sulfurtransferase [Candidatus Saccharibacteria bacterium]MBI3338362.1 rhodanese-related sulfurtransferase [Candidatus Saccharibacteria bacterium]
MQKIILFYKFVPVADPETVMFWQRNLCERLNLKGRIIISENGINGTLGGQIENIKMYIRDMNKHPLFKKIQYKWSDGNADDFPKLSVKVRKELVTLAPDEQFNVFNSTKGLKPKQWHEYIDKHPDVVILDARNDYESEIGAFKGKNVIKPKIKNFRDIKSELDKLPKDQPILTYCTGDVRCEYLSAYMKHKGFDEVYHLDGGIVKYGEEYRDSGHWEGKCFVFDERLNIAFSNKSKDIGICVHCDNQTSNHINCEDKSCNRLVLACVDCATKTNNCEQHSSVMV